MTGWAASPETLIVAIFVAVAILTVAMPKRLVRAARRLIRRLKHRPQAKTKLRAVAPAKPDWKRPHLPPKRSVDVLQSPWVLDGDTIKDRKTGVRYRLANIDAPETGDNARCFPERVKGEEAQREAIRIVRTARVVEARLTGRTDIHGRTLALIVADGRDLGGLLIKAGLARAWSGQRERWCGEQGSLLQMARENDTAWSCRTCGAGHNPVTQQPAALADGPASGPRPVLPG
jgi:micrococcal nuclease